MSLKRMTFLWGLIFFFLLSVYSILLANETKSVDAVQYKLENDKLRCLISFENDQLAYDLLENKNGDEPEQLKTDADFTLDLMWTGWRPPGKMNNAENPLLLSKKDFRLLNQQEIAHAEGGTETHFILQGINSPFQLKLIYKIKPGWFYVKKKIAICDTIFGKHFLRKIYPLDAQLFGKGEVIKPGGFGQPAALKFEESGTFFGLEYPTSSNEIVKKTVCKLHFRCGQEIGTRVGREWIESDWVVIALTPDQHVKKWFMNYLNHIRVAPLKPYSLYNSWYDLRAPEMVNDSLHIMNEENTLRIIDLFKKNMIEKYGIQLDAFVLDDGWDVYRSDWVLRKKEFPNGLLPISKALEKIGTDLGIWFGPIGGYSHRDWRINWMKDHGYEVIGDQLCLAGKNYKELFKKRVVDFVTEDDVGYYKWDGIQFSCSEPDHGHPVGIYSRRAVMESVIEMCEAVREQNPDIFLNITSGTWLSPWWLKYANQIWMQGYDYGYANVPSISRRDGAITYRDFVLYEDFHKKNFWFPIANLMTHGIIKGNLQKLGGEAEPLDKFTDNALLYFARGVSMWEFYISPDLLTDDEWRALAESINWAKDRFPILKNTEMIGGDPGERKTYGYVHYDRHNGIIAARNPKIEKDVLNVVLSEEMGLCPKAASLVLERVYPTHWISPRLYAAGAKIQIQLEGYETAVYEIYPLESSDRPLLASVIFEEQHVNDQNYEIGIFEKTGTVRLLNPEKIYRMKLDQVELDLHEVGNIFEEPQPVLSDYDVQFNCGKHKAEVDITIAIPQSMASAQMAMLLEPIDKNTELPKLKIQIKNNGKQIDPEVEKQKNRWAWYKTDLVRGKNEMNIKIQSAQKREALKLIGSIWLVGNQQKELKTVNFELVEILTKRPMPPKPWAPGQIRRTIKLKNFVFNK